MKEAEEVKPTKKDEKKPGKDEKKKATKEVKGKTKYDVKDSDDSDSDSKDSLADVNRFLVELTHSDLKRRSLAIFELMRGCSRRSPQI